MTARLEALAEQMRMNHGRVAGRSRTESYVEDWRQLRRLRRATARRKEQMRAMEFAAFGPQFRLACQALEEYAALFGDRVSWARPEYLAGR
jgi:hypothetical protein